MKQARILPSVLKGIQILQSIANQPNGMKLSEISQDLETPSSNMTLYLNTLMKSGSVIRDPLNRKFYISPRAIDLFQHAGKGLIHQLGPCADEPMQALHRHFNENILLGFRKDHLVIFIKHIRSTQVIGVNFEKEPDLPLHITAAGRAILAFLPKKEIDAYIKKASFEKVTSKTVSDETSLRRILEETRKKGFAFNPGEFEEEVMAVAVPILFNDHPIASLVMQFPLLRHTEEDAINAAPLIIEQAKIIENKLMNT
ncbi:IclR family transcriptional regulator [Tichowtungia aerotolerans]|uniref:Helix-turn-helix domain-containing protein n=1 Tax=Tichowtungia aerotolerans TaxID=2697043 RepID=A0A6P1M738_9BACT|nr:IclR family transcriptional regulator [Tichowtungia aerotolerans]QHI68394.1 helix-turn-helix domain-containing protein [Tichowtungia aerotolerans]